MERSGQSCEVVQIRRPSDTRTITGFMTLIFIVGLVLSVIAGAVVKCAIEKKISKTSQPNAATVSAVSWVGRS